MSAYDIAAPTSNNIGFIPLVITYAYALSTSQFRLGITYTNRNINTDDKYNTTVIAISF
jgi:hypothetical protein